MMKYLTSNPTVLALVNIITLIDSVVDILQYTQGHDTA